MSSTSKTMLVIRCRSNRSWAAARVKPLKSTLGVLDRADNPDRREDVEYLAQQAAIWRLARPHVRAVGLDPGPQGNVMIRERRDQERELVRWCRHVRVSEDDQIRGRGQHPGAHSRALATVRHAQHPKGRSRGSAGCTLRPRLDQRDRRIGAAVVHDHDVDRVWKAGGTRRAVAAGLGTSSQIAEQFVERRSDPLRLVERRQDDGEARMRGFRGDIGSSVRRCKGRVRVD